MFTVVLCSGSSLETGAMFGLNVLTQNLEDEVSQISDGERGGSHDVARFCSGPVAGPDQVQDQIFCVL